MEHAAPSAPPIRDAGAAEALFRPRLAHLGHEELHFAHLDAAFRLLGFTVAKGERSVVLPFRAIIGDALRLNAHGLVMAHNHPGGDPTPSQADKRATRSLATLTRPLDIHLVDHLVVGNDRTVSFRALGLL